MALTPNNHLTAAGLSGGHVSAAGVCLAPAASGARGKQGAEMWLSGSRCTPESAPELCNYTFSLFRAHADYVI